MFGGSKKGGSGVSASGVGGGGEKGDGSSPHPRRLTAKDRTTSQVMNPLFGQKIETPPVEDAARRNTLQTFSLKSKGKEAWTGLKKGLKIKGSRIGGPAKEEPNEGEDQDDMPGEKEKLVNLSCTDAELNLLNDPNANPLIAFCPGFNLELGSHEAPAYNKKFEVTLEDADKDFYYFCTYFLNRDHKTYIAEDSEVGPIVMSIEGQGEDTGFGAIRAIVRTKFGDKRVLVNGSKQQNEKALKAAGVTVKDPHLKFRQVKDPKLMHELANLEKQQVAFQKSYKFGILYRKGEQTEDEMFSNEHGSADFEEFLLFLGDKVRLKEFGGFRGGLDVKTDTTGTHSIHTKFKNFEVMFHVSTYLPFTPCDPQQIERKRHLGNDVVMVVFKEGDDPFTPSCITSNFNNIIVVVSKVHKKVDGDIPTITTEDEKENSSDSRVQLREKTYYKIAFCEKHGAGYSPPYLPEIPIFKKGPAFREFFLTKLINAERFAMRSPDFAQKLTKARTQQLKMLMQMYS